MFFVGLAVSGLGCLGDEEAVLLKRLNSKRCGYFASYRVAVLYSAAGLFQAHLQLCLFLDGLH